MIIGTLNLQFISLDFLHELLIRMIQFFSSAVVTPLFPSRVHNRFDSIFVKGMLVHKSDEKNVFTAMLYRIWVAEI